MERLNVKVILPTVASVASSRAVQYHHLCLEKPLISVKCVPLICSYQGFSFTVCFSGLCNLKLQEEDPTLGKSPGSMPCTSRFAQRLQEHTWRLPSIAKFCSYNPNIDPKTNPKEAWIRTLSANHCTISNSTFDYTSSL